MSPVKLIIWSVRVIYLLRKYLIFLGLLAASLASAAPFVTCSQIQNRFAHRLRFWVQHSSAIFTDAHTRQQLRYLVIMPDHHGPFKQAIVFFNGTSQIMSDWPLAMLRSKNKTNSLCEQQPIILFDYPGIGGTKPAISAFAFSFDNLSQDVADLLTTLAKRKPSLQLHVINPLGWSLGSLVALKFAALAQKSHLQIGYAFAIATKAGGYIDPHTPVAIGNSAQCISKTMQLLRHSNSPFLKKQMARMLFPFHYKTKTHHYFSNSNNHNNGNEVCYINYGKSLFFRKWSIKNLENRVAGFPLSADCATDQHGRDLYGCRQYLHYLQANRLFRPYRATLGIPRLTYDYERSLVHDWNYAYCPVLDKHWQTNKAACKQNPLISILNIKNGGVCETVATKGAAYPVNFNCAPLSHIKGLVIYNGAQDIYIQYTYGVALAKAYNQLGVKTKITNFPDTGHGIIYTQAAVLQHKIISILHAE